MTLYGPTSLGGGERTVSVWRGGRFLGGLRADVNVASEDDVVIGIIGDDPVGINALRETTTPYSPDSRPELGLDMGNRVWTALIPSQTIPDRWLGLQGLDVLVWPDPRPDQLTPDQLRAVDEWVASGGRLLVAAGGGTWQSLASSDLARILPVELLGSAEVAGLPELHQAVGVSVPPPLEVPIANGRLRRQAARATWTLLESPGGHPLLSAGTYGAGTVGFLAASPAVAPLRGSNIPREDLWRVLLGLSGGSVTDAVRGGVSPFRTIQGPNGYVIPAVVGLDHGYDNASAILSQVGTSPAVRPLPLIFLLVFGVGYLFVIGPLDYIVLRIAKRLEWTWVTFPLAIVAFSALAWVATNKVRGADPELRYLEIIDVFPDGEVWRGTTFQGLFTVQRGRLSLAPPVERSVVGPFLATNDLGLESDAAALRSPVIEDDGSGPELTFRVAPWDVNILQGAWVDRADEVVVLAGDPLTLAWNGTVGLTDASLDCGTVRATVGTVEPGDVIDLAGLLANPDAPASNSTLINFQNTRLPYFTSAALSTNGQRGTCTLVGLAAAPVRLFEPTTLDATYTGDSIVRVHLGPRSALEGRWAEDEDAFLLELLREVP